jgi:hypothetical protein
LMVALKLRHTRCAPDMEPPMYDTAVAAGPAV